MPKPPEVHIWEKGDYRIEAKYNQSPILGFKKRLMSWEWKHKERQDNSVRFSPWIKYPENLLNIFQAGISRGGDEIASRVDGFTLRGGDYMHFLLGRIVPIKNTRLEFQFNVGYKYGSLEGSNGKVIFSQYPVGGLLYYKLGNHKRLRLGLGVNYVYKPKISISTDSVKGNVLYDDAYGAIVQINYMGYGIRAEWIEFNSDVAGGFSGNNIGFNITSYF